MSRPVATDRRRIGNTGKFLALFAIVSLVGFGCAGNKDKPRAVKLPADVDHGSYDRLLGKYVDEQGLVAYAAWKNDQADLAALDRYLEQFAATGSEASDEEKAAGLINAYNAFTLQWILQNYPTESIWSLDDSFQRATAQDAWRRSLTR